MSRRFLSAAAIALAILSAACSRGDRGGNVRVLPQGDGVYFRDGLGSEQAAVEKIIAQGGLAHLFLPAARLEKRGDVWKVAEAASPERPIAGPPVVLVIQAAAPFEAASAESLAAAAEEAVGKAAARRAAFGKVEGIHLEIPFTPSESEPFGALAERARKAAPADLFLTCALEGAPAEKERDDYRRRLAPLDGFVAFVFGEGARGDPAATDALEKPWWAGYAPAARGDWKDAGGSPKGELLDGALSALTDEPRAPLFQELTLSSEGSSDYVFRPASSFEIAGAKFEAGDQISFRQPSISELLYRLGSDLTGRKHVRGRLVRLDGTSESQRLFTLAALSDVLLGRPLVPDLRIRIVRAPSGLRVEAENLSNHASVLSRTTNWIEVDVPPGQVRDVQLGGFDRYEVFDADGRPVTPGRAARLRFHETIVAPHERIEPAVVLLRSAPPPECCRFRQHLLAASGTEVTGDWTAPPAPPTPTPAPPAAGRAKKRR